MQCASISYLCVCEMENCGNMRLKICFLGIRLNHNGKQEYKNLLKLMVIITAFHNNNKSGMNIPAETNDVKDQTV